MLSYLWLHLVTTCLLQGKSQPSKQQSVPLPPDADDERQEYEIEDEDVQFVQQYGSQLGFLTNLDAEELNRYAATACTSAVRLIMCT